MESITNWDAETKLLICVSVGKVTTALCCFCNCSNGVHSDSAIFKCVALCVVWRQHYHFVKFFKHLFKNPHLWATKMDVSIQRPHSPTPPAPPSHAHTGCNHPARCLAASWLIILTFVTAEAKYANRVSPQWKVQLHGGRSRGFFSSKDSDPGPLRRSWKQQKLLCLHYSLCELLNKNYNYYHIFESKLCAPGVILTNWLDSCSHIIPYFTMLLCYRHFLLSCTMIVWLKQVTQLS